MCLSMCGVTRRARPAAMAIPKGGVFEGKVEQGRYGPIFPKSPACYGFSILAKVIRSLFGIEHSNDGLITFPGGLPIVDKEGILIGAIGVSGSTVENDHAVAQAGVSVVGVSDLPAHPWRT